MTGSSVLVAVVNFLEFFYNLNMAFLRSMLDTVSSIGLKNILIGDRTGPNPDFLNREKFRLDGYVVLITGSSSGIGKETARDLALRGATIIMANRDIQKSERVVEHLQKDEGESVLPADRFKIRRLDLADLASVKSFADVAKKEFPVIDMLINNAGYAYYGGNQTLTKDGFEITFQTNHLGHFYLTSLLIDNILASEKGPKIINVSSVAHAGAKMNWDDLNGDKNYGGLNSYAQSKLANVLFTRQLNELYRGKINTYSLHPGLIATDIVRNDRLFRWGVNWFYWLPFLVNEKQGAFTTIYCAVSEQAKTESGLYYSDCRVAEPGSVAKDREAAEKLWKVSCDLLKIEWSVES